VQGGKEDINILRARAGLGPTTANEQTSLLAAIEQERRVELFAEWGNRWYDLKRTAKAGTVLKVLKPLTWQDTDVLLPIPINELKANTYLEQNPGY
jgi:hypothetical protein